MKQTQTHLFISFIAAALLATALLAACGTAGSPTPVQEPPTQPPPAGPGGGEEGVPTATAVPPTSTVAPTATTVPPTATATVEPTTTHTVTATATPTETPIPSPTPQPSVEQIVAGLQGLEIDAFFEASYRELLLRRPESITALGVSSLYGVRNDRLNDLSDAYLRETQALEVAVLDLLREYDRGALSAEQQTSYDVYEWYLEDRVRGHAFLYHDYPIHHFLGSYHDELTRLLTELHPLSSVQDAEDYIARLAQVDEQVAQLLEGLARREVLGVIPPRHILQAARPGVHALTQATGTHPFYATFREKITALEGMPEDEKKALLAAARAEMAESVRPAFLELLAFVDRWITVAGDDPGVSRFPDGEAYYAHILRSHCAVDISPSKAHELGLAEVARIQDELRQVFDELGYPQDAGIPELIERAALDGGSYDTSTQAGRDEALAAYQALLDEMDGRLDEVFDLRPAAELVIVGEPYGGGGYYVPAAKDGSRPGAFHAGVGGSSVPRFDMPTIAYHEALPGHHFQLSLAQELDLPAFRNDLSFNGYIEGWALYTERLAWEMGLYDDDPYGNVGRLQFELLRAVRVVTDTGLHTMGWTRGEALAYMSETLGSRWSPEVYRYIAWPAMSVSYKIGMIKIMELRQAAMDELGDRFDLKAFHRVVLGNGNVPLDVLERLVEQYIETERQRG